MRVRSLALSDGPQLALSSGVQFDLTKTLLFPFHYFSSRSWEERPYIRSSAAAPFPSGEVCHCWKELGESLLRIQVASIWISESTDAVRRPAGVDFFETRVNWSGSLPPQTSTVDD